MDRKPARLWLIAIARFLGGAKIFLIMNIQCVIILPSGEGGVLLLAAAVSVIAAELRVGQGGNLLLKNLNLHGNKKF